MKKVSVFVSLMLCFLIVTGCGQLPHGRAANPSGQDFIAFMQETHFAAWVRGNAAAPESAFRDELGSWNASWLLTRIMRYYNGDSEKTFRPRDIDAVSEDILGYAYPFWDNAASDSDILEELNEMRWTFNDGEGLDDAVKPDTLAISGSRLNIESDISVGMADKSSTPKWTVRYTFDYIPENQYIPYRFVSAKIIAGTQFF